MVSLAVNAEPMPTFERKEVILVELQIANLAQLAFTLLNRFSLAIDKVLIEVRNEWIILSFRRIRIL